MSRRIGVAAGVPPVPPVTPVEIDTSFDQDERRLCHVA